MEKQSDKINRQVQFMYAQPYDSEEVGGKNNTWLYDRAPEGYKFVLAEVTVSAGRLSDTHRGLFAIYDGHEYTHWNQYPGVESKELLGRLEFEQYNLVQTVDLHNWECKEYTLGVRSNTDAVGFKCCVIVWYYLRKMSWLEKLQYAVLQPRGQRYRKGGATTVERSEA